MRSMDYHVACGYLCKLHAKNAGVKHSASLSNGFTPPEVKTVDVDVIGDDVFNDFKSADVIASGDAASVRHCNGRMPTSRSAFDVTLTSRSRPISSLYKTLSRALRLRSSNDVSAKRSRSVTSIFRRSGCDVTKSQSHNDFRWSQAPVICDALGSCEWEQVSRSQLLTQTRFSSFSLFAAACRFARHMISSQAIR